MINLGKSIFKNVVVLILNMFLLSESTDALLPSYITNYYIDFDFVLNFRRLSVLLDRS